MDAADRPIQRIAAIFGVLAVGSLAVGYGVRAAWIARKVGRLADTPPVRGVDRGIGVTGVKVGHVALIGDSRIAQGQDAGMCAVVTTVVPPALPSLMRRAVWKDSVRGLVMRVNDSLRERADHEGIVLLDAAAEVAGTTPRLGTAYSRDTLHFNRACYVRLTAQLEALLEDIRPASQDRRH